MANIGDVIRTLREGKGVTAKDLAERVGLSASQMSRLENGQRRVNSEVLARIARALEVTPSEFFDDGDSSTVRSLCCSSFANRHRQNPTLCPSTEALDP